MAREIIISGYEDRVRSLLGIDSGAVANEVIAYFEYRGLSELAIERELPNWEEYYSEKEAAEKEIVSEPIEDAEVIPDDTDWQAIIDDCTAKINLFESAIVFSTAISLGVAIKYGSVKARQTVNGKIEYFGADFDIKILNLKDRLHEVLQLLLDNTETMLESGFLFGITNSDQARDDRGTRL